MSAAKWKIYVVPEDVLYQHCYYIMEDTHNQFTDYFYFLNRLLFRCSATLLAAMDCHTTCNNISYDTSVAQTSYSISWGDVISVQVVYISVCTSSGNNCPVEPPSCSHLTNQYQGNCDTCHQYSTVLFWPIEFSRNTPNRQPTASMWMWTMGHFLSVQSVPSLVCAIWCHNYVGYYNQDIFFLRSDVHTMWCHNWACCPDADQTI